MNTYIYKYASEEKFILDILRYKRLYFNKPSDFNDPFECHPPISIEKCHCNSDKIWKDFLFYFFYTQYYKRPKQEIKRIANDAFASDFHKNHKQLRKVDKNLEDIGKLVRICCFSKTSRNTMMWAHYANKQKGIVLQFRTQGLCCESGDVRAFLVNYINKKISLNEYVEAMKEEQEQNNHKKITQIHFATKSKYWEQEEEVRFFSKKHQKYIYFEETALSGIIFGSACSDWLIQQILDELITWEYKPKLYKTNIEKSTHRLYIENFNCSTCSP